MNIKKNPTLFEKTGAKTALRFLAAARKSGGQKVSGNSFARYFLALMGQISSKSLANRVAEGLRVKAQRIVDFVQYFI